MPSLKNLDVGLRQELATLYLRDPLNHVYLFYSLTQEPEKCYILVNHEGDRLRGYILLRKAPRAIQAHVYGEVGDLLDKLRNARFRIRVAEDLESSILERLKSVGRVERVEKYLKMVVDSGNFKAFSPKRAIRLTGKHLEHFIELEESKGRHISASKALKVLEKWRYYGVFVSGKLVSVACAFIMLPEIWVIGNVYTHPDFRGRGYAKIVTSAVTQDALNHGARVLLHVRQDNEIAITVYRKIGYSVIGRETWITFERNTTSRTQGGVERV